MQLFTRLVVGCAAASFGGRAALRFDVAAADSGTATRGGRQRSQLLESNNDGIALAKGQRYCQRPYLQVGGFGQGESQLAGADTVEVDNAGNIYIVDDVQSLIKVFPLYTSTGAATDIISSVDFENNGLAPLGDIEAVATGSFAAAVDDTALYVLDRDKGREPPVRILHRPSRGESWVQLAFVSFEERPEDITVDIWGRIVVSERGGVIEVLDPSGESLDSSFGEGGTVKLGEIEGLEADRLKAVDTDLFGDIYVADKNAGRIIKVDSHGNFVQTFGSEGTGIDQFLEQIEGVGVDTKGLVYGRDESGDRVLVFDVDGTFVEAFGMRGFEPDQQENADEFFLDKIRNKFVFADNGNYRVSVHSLKPGDCSSSKIFTEYDYPTFPIIQPLWIAGGVQGSDPGMQFDEPNELGFDLNGNLWAGDVFNLRLQIYDASGAFLATVGGPGSAPGQFIRPPSGKYGPESIRVDSLNRIWAVDRGGVRINLYNADTFEAIGSFLFPTEAIITDPTGLAIDSFNNLYIADQGTDTVFKFEFNGTGLVYNSSFQELDGTGSAILAKVETLTLDEARDLLFATSEDESLVRTFKLSTGKYLGEQVGERQVGVVPQDGRFNDDVEGLAADPVNDLLFMSDERNGRFLVHDLSASENEDLFDDDEDYAFIGAFGMQGNDPGKFLSADGVAVNAEGTLVAIADQGNYRIQVFHVDDIVSGIAGVENSANFFDNPTGIVCSDSSECAGGACLGSGKCS